VEPANKAVLEKAAYPVQWSSHGHVINKEDKMQFMDDLQGRAISTTFHITVGAYLCTKAAKTS
jgi:hypothetical protein